MIQPGYHAYCYTKKALERQAWHRRVKQRPKTVSGSALSRASPSSTPRGGHWHPRRCLDNGTANRRTPSPGCDCRCCCRCPPRCHIKNSHNTTSSFNRTTAPRSRCPVFWSRHLGNRCTWGLRLRIRLPLSSGRRRRRYAGRRRAMHVMSPVGRRGGRV